MQLLLCILTHCALHLVTMSLAHILLLLMLRMCGFKTRNYFEVRLWSVFGVSLRLTLAHLDPGPGYSLRYGPSRPSLVARTGQDGSHMQRPCSCGRQRTTTARYLVYTTTYHIYVHIYTTTVSVPTYVNAMPVRPDLR